MILLTASINFSPKTALGKGILLILTKKSKKMEKPWFPQRNGSDTIAALLKTFIFHSGVKVSRATIEKDVQNHKEFPHLTLEGLREILKVWGVQTLPLSVETNSLKELPPLSFLFISEENGNAITKQFVLYFGIEDDDIEYLHTRKGWVTEDLEQFETKWSKVALAITGIDEKSGEPDFEQIEKEYDKVKFNNPELKDNVRLYDDFLTNEECEHIINISKPLFQRSLFLYGDKAVVDDARTSFSAELHVFPDDEIMDNIRQRAAKLLSIPASHFEYFQCVSYDKTQEIHAHYDTFDRNSEGGKKIIAEGGQRKYTMLGYLNDDFVGGGTYFPNLDFMVHPKKGRILIFNNIDDEGKNIKPAFHAGLPVIKGRKYAVNMWVRDKPCR